MTSYMRENLGVTDPLQESATINIGCSSGVLLNKHTTGNYDSFKAKQADVSQTDLNHINARAAVFHSVSATKKAVQLSGNRGTSLRADDLRVTQCTDNLSAEDYDDLEFVGIALDEIDGKVATAKSQSSQASTAVRISGTITAIRPLDKVPTDESNFIPPFSRVRWEYNTAQNPQKIRGVPRVRLPLMKASKSNRVDRIREVLRNNKSDYVESKILAVTKKLDLNDSEEEVNQARDILMALVPEFDALYEHDGRHNIGICLDTRCGQIDLLLSK